MEPTTELEILAAPILEELPWAAFSACRDADPELFFGGTKEQTEKALAICRSCAVRRECLDHALEVRERFGIWGGMTESERRKLLRQIVA
ncbi:MAG TPA: WhiB family transcriptional regulator [Actinobacteria bacterium]|nr:WhiB family transcriptional regulator [Actinomycetota bacterium]